MIKRLRNPHNTGAFKPKVLAEVSVVSDAAQRVTQILNELGGLSGAWKVFASIEEEDGAKFFRAVVRTTARRKPIVIELTLHEAQALALTTARERIPPETVEYVERLNKER